MAKHLCWAVVVLLTVGAAVRGATPEQVDAAIHKAKEYLYSRQVEGNWEKVKQRQKGKGASVESGQC